MILKEIGRKIVQAFRSVKGADEKVASSIATSLDTIAERARKYEKSFEPEPPEPDLPQEINTAPPFTFEFYLAGIPIAQNLAERPKRNRRRPADADEEKHPQRASGMEPGKMSDLRTGMLETNIKAGAPAEENASSLHRVRTQNRK